MQALSTHFVVILNISGVLSLMPPYPSWKMMAEEYFYILLDSAILPQPFSIVCRTAGCSEQTLADNNKQKQGRSSAPSSVSVYYNQDL